MQVPIRLLLDRVDDRSVAVARVLAADPTGEVDEDASLGVGDAGTLGGRDDEPGSRDAAGDVPRAPGEDLCGGLLLDRSHAREYDGANAQWGGLFASQCAGFRVPRNPRSWVV